MIEQMTIVEYSEQRFGEVVIDILSNIHLQRSEFGIKLRE
jgi:hypothetical protein